jgi:hypothetical protein
MRLLLIEKGVRTDFLSAKVLGTDFLSAKGIRGRFFICEGVRDRFFICEGVRDTARRIFYESITQGQIYFICKGIGPICLSLFVGEFE